MNPPTLVVLRALGLGDLLTAIPALRALRRGLPDHRMVLLSPPWLNDLIAPDGLADEVVAVDGKDRLPLALPALGPVDVAVDLQGRGPASQRLLLEQLRPRRLIAFDSPGTHRGPVAWREEEHEVYRWVRLVEAYGFSANRDELSISVPLAVVPPAWRGALLLHPGASAAARRWPEERWVQLARSERTEGRRLLISAGPGEITRADTIARRAGLGAGAVIAPHRVTDLIALISVVGAVVVGDTGVAHVASAVRTPSVVLFGPTSPSRWGPPERSIHRVLWDGQVGDPHADVADPGLLRITHSGVRAELRAIACR